MRRRLGLIVWVLCSCGRSVLVNELPDAALHDADLVDAPSTDPLERDTSVPRDTSIPRDTSMSRDTEPADACCRDVEPGCNDDLELEFAWPTEGPLTPLGVPVVGELTGGGPPELVFITVDGANEYAVHILDVLDPEAGINIPLSDTMSVEPLATPAIGDLDLDGTNEVVVVGSSWWPGLVARRKRVIAAFDANGSRLWRFVDPNWSWGTNGSVSIADLDADGNPEVVLGSTVLRGRDGALLSQGPLDTSHGVAVLRSRGPVSCVAEIDGDDQLEIVAGRSVFEANGDARWNVEFEDGFSAVADFLPRPGREVLLISDGYARILAPRDGELLWRVSLVGSARGTGSPPTIADFDGDSFAEFALTSFGGPAVYDATCTDCVEDGVLRILPDGAPVHGAFDFNLDGIPELLSGPGILRVFDVTRDDDEIPRYAAEGYAHTSPPIVADVDADGEAEIVAMGFSRTEASPRPKVLVWGHAEHGWPRARPVWTQGNFEPSQVDDAGRLSGRSEHVMLRGTEALPRMGAGTCIAW